MQFQLVDPYINQAISFATASGDSNRSAEERYALAATAQAWATIAATQHQINLEITKK